MCMQGTDAGVQPDSAALIQSTAGTPMDGVVVGNTVVLFIVDATTPFNGHHLHRAGQRQPALYHRLCAQRILPVSPAPTRPTVGW